MSLCRFLQLAKLRGLLSCLLAFALLPIEVVRSQSPSTIVLSAAATPNAAEPNVTATSVTGSGFPSGTIAPSAVTVHLAPVAPATGPAMVAVVSAVTTLFGTSRRISVSSSAGEPAPGCGDSDRLSGLRLRYCLWRCQLFQFEYGFVDCQSAGNGAVGESRCGGAWANTVRDHYWPFQ